VDRVWLDVQMWTGLRGTFHHFTEIACAPPAPVPDTVDGWEVWAPAQLAAVAGTDGWQPGRYHWTAEQRDGGGRAVAVFARGVWDHRT
jgi:hypothetical protein